MCGQKSHAMPALRRAGAKEPTIAGAESIAFLDVVANTPRRGLTLYEGVHAARAADLIIIPSVQKLFTSVSVEWAVHLLYITALGKPVLCIKAWHTAEYRRADVAPSTIVHHKGMMTSQYHIVLPDSFRNAAPAVSVAFKYIEESTGSKWKIHASIGRLGDSAVVIDTIAKMLSWLRGVRRLRNHRGAKLANSTGEALY